MNQPARFGRFEVRRPLGRGAQSAVYLAHDPDLDREVAIKWLKPGAPGGDAVRREARTVSQLNHPNLVAIHELGEREGRTYLVFDYVAGRSLEQVLKAEGALPPRRAAELMVGILDAIAAAHDQGVIHRDLKPSNILLDAQGRPRVMDFGIASRPAAAQGLEPDLTGSPAYMAPEYIAHRRVTPQYDLFSAGLMLYEMALGQRAVQGESALQAIHQIANVPLVFPADAPARLGPVLQDIIVKATAKETQLRYASAREMQKALKLYLDPPLQADPAAQGQAGTLEFLLRRMKVKGDFPAMSAAIHAIQRLAASDRANVNSLSNSILKDFALTNKILRLVNSAYYASRSGERIRTVSRAIVMLGFDAVRSLAISLMLFDRIRDKQQAGVLQEEFLRTNLSGILARELSARLDPAQAEEAFICALFHNLGRLLTCYYFWEEAEMIRNLAAAEGCSEDAAALRVLGLRYQDLGIGVAQSWGFPPSITQSMRSLGEGKPPKALTPDARLHQISALANEVCAGLDGSDPAERAAAVAKIGARYGASLGFSARDLDQVTQRAVTGLGELADTLHINLRKTALGQRICAPEDAVPAPSVSAPAASSAELVEAAPTESGDAEAVLSAGIQDVSRGLVEDMPLGDVLRVVAETLYRALGVRRVLMCTRDGRSNRMQARFGFGAEADELTRHFGFALGGADLFNAILGQDTGVLIRDATEPKLRARLPPWYLEKVDAPCFIVFPMNLRKQSLAMIYADQDRPGGISVSDAQLALLHTLRNQALLAIRQSS